MRRGETAVKRWRNRRGKEQSGAPVRVGCALLALGC